MPSSAQISPSFRLRTESLNSVRLRRVFDGNGDGVITAAEISQALVLEKLGLGDGRSLDGVREMICSADADKDDLFKHMMRSISIKSS